MPALFFTWMPVKAVDPLPLQQRPHRYRGRYLYIRRTLSGTPAGSPAARELDRYSCRHGLGYTRSAERKLLQAELTFVPPGEDMEIWALRLREP